MNLRGIIFSLISAMLLTGCAKKPASETSVEVSGETKTETKTQADVPIEIKIEIPAGASTEELNRIGVQFIYQERWQEAEEIFRQVLNKDSQDGAAHNNLGFCYQKKNEIEKAIEEYEKALECSNNPVVLRQAHLNLAHIYMNSEIEPPIRQPDWSRKAAEHLEALLEYEPDSAVLHMWLGFAYFGATNPGGGLIELEKASELAKTKEETWIHQRIMNFYTQIGMTDKMSKEADIIEKLEGE